MILHGNQRGGAKDLGLHLLKVENEHVEVHEIRGFASENLAGALNEAYAISQGTRCKQFLYSLSLSPPPNEKVKTESFEAAIEQVEHSLGLIDQPRAIVFHEKDGRRHCHAVWSRIDGEKMKAINIAHPKYKLRDISRELFIEHGWQMPRGLMNSQERDIRNFTHDEWQQARRIGKDPRAIKAALQDSWATSDTQSAFAHSLKERGYVLAQGDRRGFVAVDIHGEVYSVPKWVGIRTKGVRDRLGDQNELPSVSMATEQIKEQVTARLHELKHEQTEAIAARKAAIKEKLSTMQSEHKAKRQELTAHHELRWQAETKIRKERFNTGIRGAFDRISGKHKNTRKQNEREAYTNLLRDRTEKDSLIFKHLDERRALHTRAQRLDNLRKGRVKDLSADIKTYQDKGRDIRQDLLERYRGRSNHPPPRPQDKWRDFG
jgi:hypothetical protein